MARTLVALAALATPACRDPERAKDDRLIAKLKEHARLDAGPSTPDGSSGPQNEAEAVTDRLQRAIAATDKTGPLPLPQNNATFRLGSVEMKLVALSKSHEVSAGRLSLASEDLFLKVQLVAQNVGPRPARVDLGLARLVDGTGAGYDLAADAQRAAGTRTLTRELPVGERTDWTLYFEVPPQALGKDLRLQLPAAVAGVPELAVPLE